MKLSSITILTGSDRQPEDTVGEKCQRAKENPDLVSVLLDGDT